MKLEKQKLVKVTFGSRLYGTNDENSDIDSKVIYLPDIAKLLIGVAPKNSKERAVGPNAKMMAGEEEIEYIPLQRFAIDFFEGQSYAYELAFAIANDTQSVFHTIYDNDSFRIYHFISRLIHKFLTCDISKMVGYAIHQSQVYGVKGERLKALTSLVEVLRPVAIENKSATLAEWNIVIAPLLSDLVFYTKINGTNDAYIDKPALVVNGKVFALNNSVSYVVEQLDKMIVKYGHRAQKATVDSIDWKALSHAIRIVAQANTILVNGYLQFPLPEADYLRAVKQGKVPFEDAVSMFEQLNNEMEANLKTSKLRAKTPELRHEFDEWLGEQLKDFYNISMT